MAAPSNVIEEKLMNVAMQQRQQHAEAAAAGGGVVGGGPPSLHTEGELDDAVHLLYFAGQGNLEAVREIVADGTSVNAADYDGRTALHLAASEGKMDVVKLLVSLGADVNPRDRWGSTPLTDARHYGFAEISRYLQERGAMTPMRSPLAATPQERSGTNSPIDFEVDPQELDFRHATSIGKGPLGEIRLANWRGTRVVVKMIEADVSHSARLEKELFFVKKLRHPNVVQFLGAVTSSQPHMLITEYLPGGDLWKIMKRKGPLQTKEAVGFALDIARGMNYLHQLRPEAIIHRDLKPRNLLRDEAGHLKVADFGVSKLLDVQLTEDAEPGMGEDDSYRYMAPELFHKEAYDKSVDIYSFGVIVHEMFEGPIEETNLAAPEIAEKYAVQNYRPSFEAKAYPPGMKELISECWSRDPTQRPSFAQILERLEGMEGAPASYRKSDSSGRKPAAPTKSREPGGAKGRCCTLL